MPSNNHLKNRPGKWRRWRRNIRRFIWPIVFIGLALGAIGYVTYEAISDENDSKGRLFGFKANDGKIINLIRFRDLIAHKNKIKTTSVTAIDLKLLERSLENNLGMPAGGNLQKFNYVVTKDGEIAVAVWTEQAYHDRMYDKVEDPNYCDLDDNWSMPGDPNAVRPDTTDPVMVNIYPEF